MRLEDQSRDLQGPRPLGEGCEGVLWVGCDYPQWKFLPLSTWVWLSFLRSLEAEVAQVPAAISQHTSTAEVEAVARSQSRGLRAILRLRQPWGPHPARSHPHVHAVPTRRPFLGALVTHLGDTAVMVNSNYAAMFDFSFWGRRPASCLGVSTAGQEIVWKGQAEFCGCRDEGAAFSNRECLAFF